MLQPHSDDPRWIPVNCDKLHIHLSSDDNDNELISIEFFNDTLEIAVVHEIGDQREILFSVPIEA